MVYFSRKRKTVPAAVSGTASSLKAFKEETRMSRVFNINGDCKPDLHYMVDLHSRLEAIKGMIDEGQYFTINRARQYGKTTTLRALKEYLKDTYHVISMDFQVQMSYAKFRSENTFSLAFAKAFIRSLRSRGMSLHSGMRDAVQCLDKAVREDSEALELVELFQYLSDICRESDKPLVLMIDEIDSAANNQVFLDFLSQLRGYYIDRDQSPTFQSVILAGVYDVKNLKRKFRPEEVHKTNSPWNIAMDFSLDMSFSPKEIAGMLEGYAQERQVNMDVGEIAGLLYEYTSGYPYLVSRLCKSMDEKNAGKNASQDPPEDWSREGFLEAVKLLLNEKNTLFDSLTGKLEDYPELRDMLYLLLFQGQSIAYNPDNPVMDMARMFGFVKVSEGSLVIANRIFETRLYNLFLTLPQVQGMDIYQAACRDKNQFIREGRLDMRLIMERFVVFFDEIYGDRGERFYEEDGRRYFMLYLRPIINGGGNYYIEARTRDMERTDLIVDYHGEQFIIELKLWRGKARHQAGEEQLADYLDHYHARTGYLLTFNFNRKKEMGVREVRVRDKMLVEAFV